MLLGADGGRGHWHTELPQCSASFNHDNVKVRKGLALALAGVPLFFSGFWSKDEILAVLLDVSKTGPHGNVYFVVYLISVFTAFLTAFYTFRAYFKTFWGEEKFPEEAGHHVTEHALAEKRAPCGLVFIGAPQDLFGRRAQRPACAGRRHFRE